MIRLNILNFDQCSAWGVPWSAWCPLDETQIESVRSARACRGFQDVSMVFMKSGDRFFVGQSVDEISKILSHPYPHPQAQHRQQEA